MKSQKGPRTLTLGDLVIAVSSSSRNSRERNAAITDLFEDGRVQLQVGEKKIVAHLR